MPSEGDVQGRVASRSASPYTETCTPVLFHTSCCRLSNCLLRSGVCHTGEDLYPRLLSPDIQMSTEGWCVGVRGVLLEAHIEVRKGCPRALGP